MHTAVVFWSGGKDAFLAYREIENQYERIYLLVTYDNTRNTVPLQEIHMSHIRKQTSFLDLPLLETPLPPSCPNDEYVNSIANTLENARLTTCDLIFGDLHIDEIRQWRQSVFQPSGFTCRFPIWNMDYDTLFNRLFSYNISIRLTHVDPRFEHIIQPGTLYNRQFIKELPEEIDAMGEFGEFHTRIEFEH